MRCIGVLYSKLFENFITPHTAKYRYKKNKITRKEIQELLNVMQNHGATEGYFITTSSFAPDAEELADQNGHIILLDKVKLQQQLDKTFGVNKYCIVNYT